MSIPTSHAEVIDEKNLKWAEKYLNTWHGKNSVWSSKREQSAGIEEEEDEEDEDDEDDKKKKKDKSLEPPFLIFVHVSTFHHRHGKYDFRRE